MRYIFDIPTIITFIAIVRHYFLLCRISIYCFIRATTRYTEIKVEDNITGISDIKIIAKIFLRVSSGDKSNPV